MSSVIAIPPENSVYDSIRIALNERRIRDAFAIFDSLTPQESLVFMTKYSELYILLNQVYMREKMTTTADTGNF